MSTYTAFISYASRDHFIAERMQKALEAYKVPRRLRGELGLAEKRLGAFFRDQSDLAASHSLTEILQESLDASRFLIVLCSPTSAASEWVNAEIRHFVTRGREGDIIPVIVSGAPSRFDAVSNPDGAFAPALFPFADSAEPLAPVIGPDNDFVQVQKSFDNALLQVIARVLGVSFGRMKDRHAEQLRRDRRVRVSVMAAFTGVLATAVFGWWLANRGDVLIAADDADDLRGIQLLLSDRERYYDRLGMSTIAQGETIDTARRNLDGGRFGEATDPALTLEQVWVSVRLAELAEKTFSFDIVPAMLDDARHALAKVDDEMGKANAVVWLPDFSVKFDPPAPLEIDLARIAVLDLEARHLRRQKDFAGAHTAMTQAMAISQKWHGAAGADAGPIQSAQSACRLGHTIYLTGDYAKAQQTLQDCAQALHAASSDPNAQIARVSVDAKVQAGVLARGLGDRDAAFAAHQEAYLWTQEQGLHNSDNVQARILAIRTAMTFADSLLAVGKDPTEAIEVLRNARDQVNALIATDQSRSDWENDKLLVLERLATAYQYQLGSAAPQDRAQIFDDATTAISDAIEIAEGALADDPSSIDRRHNLSVMYETRAILNFNRMRFLTGFDQVFFDAALADMREVIAMREETFRRVPDDLSKEYALANAKANMSRIYAQSPNHADRAFAYAAQAMAALQVLIDKHPTEPHWHFEIALLHYEGAQLAASHGDLAGARQARDESKQIIDRLLQDYPDNASFSLAKSQIQELSEGWENAN